MKKSLAYHPKSICLFILCICLSGLVFSQKTVPVPAGSIPVSGIQPNLSDSALLDIVQRQTFRYFWDFAHPVSGMARERSNIGFGYGHETVTTGGTGFGIMSVIVAVERNWISRDTAARFMLKMVNFLLKANSYHGAFPHWMDGATGKTIPFSRLVGRNRKFF